MIVNNEPTAYNFAALRQYLVDNSFNSYTRALPANGSDYVANVEKNVIGIYRNDSNQIRTIYANGIGSQETGNVITYISDKVVKC